MFAAATLRLAEAEGLRLTLLLENQPGSFGREDVGWTRLAFANGKKGVKPKSRPHSQKGEAHEAVAFVTSLAAVRPQASSSTGRGGGAKAKTVHHRGTAG